MSLFFLECSIWNPLCKGAEAVGDKLEAAAGGAFERFIVSMNEATARVISMTLSWWMDPALSPQVSGGGAAASIASVQGATSVLVLLAAFLGIVIAMAKMAITHHARFGRDAVFMLVTTSIATIFAAAATQLFIGWSDRYSTWMMTWASTQTGKSSPEDLLTSTVTTRMLSVSLLSSSLTVLAALAQAAFMVLRAALIPIILVFLPVSAATTATGAGKESFNKLLSWLVAFVLYKPVAATIYALGMVMVTGTHASGADEDVSWFKTAVSGMVVISLAVLALPALIKLCAPLAGPGTSSMFSGGSALVMAAGAATGAIALGPAVGATSLAGAGASGAAGGSGALSSGSPGATRAAESSGATYAPPALDAGPRSLTSGGGGASSGSGPTGGGGAPAGGPSGPSLPGTGSPSTMPDGGASSPSNRAQLTTASTVTSVAKDVKTNAEGAVSDDPSH